MVIRTLGLYQPFAGLMLYGKIETRWIRADIKPPFPLGKYLIYATKKKYNLDVLSVICGDQHKRVVDIACSDKNDSCDITGSAICICDLVKRIDPLTPEYEQQAFVTVPASFTDDCYRMVGLVFENVQRIEPFPFKGKQGIGFLSDEDKAKIKVLEAPMMGMSY